MRGARGHAAGRGSGLARAGDPSCAPPPLRRPRQRSEPPGAAGIRRPLRLSHRLYLASLAFLGPASSLSAWPSPVEVFGSLSVWGVGLPHCFSCFSVLLRLASPARCLPLWLPLPSFVLASAPLGLPQSTTRLPHQPPISASQYLRAAIGPLIVPAPLELLSEPRCVPVSPRFFQLPRLALGLRHPLPVLSNNEKPCAPKAPSLPRGSGVPPKQFSTPSLGEPWDPHPRVIKRVQLHLHCAKGEGG